MKRTLCLILAVFLLVSVPALAGDAALRDIVFQTSTIDALLAGLYDGDLTCGALKHHGGFGLGTFDGLEGEMVVLDGVVYQIKTDGKAYRMGDEVTTPFAAVTFFEPDKVIQPGAVKSLKDLEQAIDAALPTLNIFYAVKITGKFAAVTTRSVPKQTKPYPPLVEVVKQQAVFNFKDVEGTIVGFRSPPFVKGVNVPGYHLHFLTADAGAGGHVLDLSFNDLDVALDLTHGFALALPESGDFYATNLDKDKAKELEKVEKK